MFLPTQSWSLRVKLRGFSVFQRFWVHLGHLSPGWCGMGRWGERGGWKGVTWKLFCSAQAGTWGLAWEAKSSPLPWSPVLLCPLLLALLIHSSQQPRVNPLL